MDERLPLLQETLVSINAPLLDDTSKNVIDFDPNGDAENPMNWPRAYKWSVVALLALTAFTVTFTCISVVPVASQIITDLQDGQPNKSASVLLVTIWELGEAAGPLLIAPLSEIFGRYPVLNIANLLFVAATVAAALSATTHQLIAARFMTGLAVASNVLSPAIVGDIFVAEQRGTALSIIMLAPLIGGAIGPAISGAIAEHLGWRRIMWVCAVLAGACELVFLLCFRETYKTAILQRRAKKLQRETGNLALKTAIEDAGEGKRSSMVENILRPMIVLYSSGVLQIATLVGGIIYAYFYIMSTTLPDILQEVYGLSPTMCGFAFICFSIGSTISVFICNASLDRLYIRLRDANGGVGVPEHRLPLAIAGVCLFPIVIALYGWVPQAHLPMPAELAMVGLWGFCVMLGELPLVAYVVDAFGLFSASAMTAMIVVRCLLSTFLPMAMEPLFSRLGYGWGMSVAAAVTLTLAPTTFLIMRCGARLRQRSQYSQDGNGSADTIRT